MVNGLKREELIAANSMILHELYFDSLGGEGDPAGALAEAIARDFGSARALAGRVLGHGQGAGRRLGLGAAELFAARQAAGQHWAADHTMTLAGGRPILALDMYEHAYHMDYGARAAAYVDGFMQGIRWSNAQSLFERYSKET